MQLLQSTMANLSEAFSKEQNGAVLIVFHVGVKVSGAKSHGQAARHHAR